MKMETVALPGDITQITLAGRLDVAGAQAIDQPFSILTTVKAGRFVIDLSGVEFLASIGIRLLMTAARTQTRRGGAVVLAAPTPMVRKVLETAGIDQLIPLVADVEQGVAGLSG